MCRLQQADGGAARPRPRGAEEGSHFAFRKSRPRHRRSSSATTNWKRQPRCSKLLSIKDKTAVVLDTSACYAEMGGQVGDTGELSRRQAKSGHAPSSVSTRRSPATPGCTRRCGGRTCRAHRGDDAGQFTVDATAPRGHPTASHRHASAALGAARGGQQGRRAEGLIRRAGEADVRLQQRPADAGAGRRRGETGQRTHCRERAASTGARCRLPR